MNSESSDDPVAGLSEFFKTIWQDTEGFVYLPTINRETGKWRRVFFEWPKHEPLIVQHVLASTAQGLDSYYSPALYKDHTNATKDNILGSHVLWTEFDGAAPDNWENGASESASEPARPGDGHKEAQTAMPTPSLRVQSSQDGHEHVYWRLNEFVTDAQWIEDKNRSITYEYGADSSGWDSTQILRPPYTTNFKRDLPVTIRQSSATTYSTDRFAYLKPPAQLVNESIDVENLPSVDSIIAKYKWDETYYNLFKADSPQDRSGGLMKLGFFGAEKGMTDAEIYAILLNADDRWKKYVNRQDRKRRLTDIVNRARQKHPKPLESYTFDGLLKNTKSLKIEQGIPLTYGFKSFLESSIEVEWAIEGLIEKGGQGMVAAMPGVGKTQFSIQLACESALGKKFLKWDTLRQHKIVLFSLEMSHVALKFFMEAIAQEYDEEQQAILEKNLLIVPLGEVIHLDRPEGLQFVFSLLDEFQPDGIVIDSIGKTTMEELNEKVSRLLNVQFREIRNRYDCFLWFIHHNRKATDNNKKPTALSDVYGNMYLTADMTSVIILWADQKVSDDVEVIPVKARLSKLLPAFVTHRNANLHFSIKATTDDTKIVENLNGHKSKEGDALQSTYGNGDPTTFRGLQGHP
jgi:KaiC/GvpD/RAD55 family RecA-like ATPase